MPSLPPKPGVKSGSTAPQGARAQEDAERQDRHRTEELADACGSLEEGLEALKARFELFFLGFERREPSRERDEMKRRIAKLKGEFTRNTGLRFRIQTLHARFVSYERMWLRSAREKEEGTYRRDLQRARRHAARLKGGAAPNAPESGSASDTERDGSRPGSATGVPVPPPAGGTANEGPAAPAAPAPGPTPPSTLPESQLRTVYEEYVAAKRRCNEDVSRLTYDTLVRSVSKQVPELLAKYNARSVEFRVVIKDGRAVLKAVPRT